MAKALLGHIGGPDPRMLAEMRRLQQQIRDLESELVRLQEENDVLSAKAGNDMLTSVREQART
jgi:cell division protein FtsB